MTLDQVLAALPRKGTILLRQVSSPCGDETCCWEVKNLPATLEEAIEALPAWGESFTLEQEGDVTLLFDQEGESDLPLLIW